MLARALKQSWLTLSTELLPVLLAVCLLCPSHIANATLRSLCQWSAGVRCSSGAPHEARRVCPDTRIGGVEKPCSQPGTVSECVALEPPRESHCVGRRGGVEKSHLTKGSAGGRLRPRATAASHGRTNGAERREASVHLLHRHTPCLFPYAVRQTTRGEGASGCRAGRSSCARRFWQPRRREHWEYIRSRCHGAPRISAPTPVVSDRCRVGALLGLTAVSPANGFLGSTVMVERH